MFRDRTHAGRLLAEELEFELSASDDVVVYGIPRGGVIVAAEVARRLKRPLDVVIASKIGSPGNPEYAIGAVDADGAVTQNVYAGYSLAELGILARSAHEKVESRLALYASGGAPIAPAGHTAVIVDDGIATGLTAFAAADYLRRHGATRIVLAVPVIAGDTARTLRGRVDAVIALEEPELFYAVGQFYRNFDEVTDNEVIAVLREARGDTC